MASIADCGRSACLCVLVGQMVESDGSEEAAEAVENLLESYFMQIDGTYDRLVSICNCPLLVLAALLHNFQKRKRKEYAFLRQFHEKPSIIPGCPGA
jgi:hypothetical protein